MKKFYFVIPIIILILFNCCSQVEHNQEKAIKLATKNIIKQLHLKSENKVILVNSKNKTRITDHLKIELQSLNIPIIQFCLHTNSDSLQLLSSLIQNGSENLSFIFLIDESDAKFLFQYVGRPDVHLKIPNERLFCNWLISEDQLIRLNSINFEENIKYQKKVANALNTIDTISISTKAGTNIKFIARNWIIDKGEIYCTPIENETNGVIIVDGCIYWGPPSKPIKLEILEGRAINIDSLSEADKQEKILKNDLTTDENTSILTEIGIGTNKNALWNSDIMESEQARGTCHFGFGMNLNYGGQINSKKHFDVVILNPTIKINNTLIYKDGKLKIK